MKRVSEKSFLHSLFSHECKTLAFMETGRVGTGFSGYFFGRLWLCENGKTQEGPGKIFGTTGFIGSIPKPASGILE